MANQTARHRTIYAVPEYVVSKHIPESIVKHLPNMLWADSYKYTMDRPTMSELAKLQGLKTFDVALPIDWVREFEEKTGFNPVGHFVMSYDENAFGFPLALTREGIVAAQIYNHLQS